MEKKIIKLPKMSFFECKTRRNNPLEKFFFWVGKKLGGYDKERDMIKIMSFSIHEKDYKRLEAALRKWVKTVECKGFGSHYIDKTVQGSLFQYGPCSHDKSVKEGTVAVDSDWLDRGAQIKGIL